MEENNFLGSRTTNEEVSQAVESGRVQSGLDIRIPPYYLEFRV